MRVVVAMSGGVDSTVAAALLADEGHEVIGLSMQLYDQREGEVRFGSCCTIDDLHDARRAAAFLGVRHYIVNLEDRFRDTVVTNFVEEYLAGRTPIPCARCNSDVKFATLLERAVGLEADRLATGHYARIGRDPSTGRCTLDRGLDPAKDQAYFLFSLTQAQLERSLFPVGTWTKPQVRAFARERGLPVADKPDSQEICFVPDGEYAAFVERRAGPLTPAEGLITDTAGRVLGRHHGVHRFTVGQRKGLGLSSPLTLYVVSIDAEASRVVVGGRDALEQRALEARDVNWISGEPPSTPRRVHAQIRHRHQAAAATITAAEADRLELLFDVPQSAITPGQAVVCYEGTRVLGGGWIERALVM
jgi:tRNA-specific 2-thiouridylase